MKGRREIKDAPPGTVGVGPPICSFPGLATPPLNPLCVAPWSPIQTLIRTVFALSRTALFSEMKFQKRTEDAPIELSRWVVDRMSMCLSEPLRFNLKAAWKDL